MITNTITHRIHSLLNQLKGNEWVRVCAWSSVSLIVCRIVVVAHFTRYDTHSTDRSLAINTICSLSFPLTQHPLLSLALTQKLFFSIKDLHELIEIKITVAITIQLIPIRVENTFLELNTTNSRYRATTTRTRWRGQEKTELFCIEIGSDRGSDVEWGRSAYENYTLVLINPNWT